MYKKYYIIVAVLFVLLACIVLLKEELEIDSCLDNGGRWNYENKLCEHS